MDEKLNFIVYCIEEYKSAEKLSGKAVIDLFNRYRVIEYIHTYYEALYATGRQYIVDDISLYINALQQASPRGRQAVRNDGTLGVTNGDEQDDYSCEYRRFLHHRRGL